MSLSTRRTYYRFRNNAAVWSKFALLAAVAFYVTARLVH